MPILVDEDELLEEVTDVEEDDKFPLPQPKRMKIDKTQIKDEPIITDDTNDDGDRPCNSRSVHRKHSQPSRLHATPVQSSVPRVEIKPSLSNFPRSLYGGWEPPLVPTVEHTALNELLQSYNCAQDYIMVPLREFRIYRPLELHNSTVKKNRQNELEPLHRLKADVGCDRLLIDGVMTMNGKDRYIEGTLLETLAIEGYGDRALGTVANHISIQTSCASAKGVWYLLEQPSADYEKYHRLFLWVADFAKHVIDYLGEHDRVPLGDFQSRFHKWINRRHGKNKIFQQWIEDFRVQGQDLDFRQAAVAYASFLWKEAWDVVDNPRKHPLWTDINYLPGEEMKEQATEEASSNGKTLVTPYVRENFKHITQLCKFFDSKEPTGFRVRVAYEERKRALGFTDAHHAQQQTRCVPSFDKGKLRHGDYVAVRPEERTIWRDGSEFWYAYIQGIRKDRYGEIFDVIWLYSASATTLAGGAYLFKNELFLSSHCNCDEALLRNEHIIGKVIVACLSSATTGDLSGENPHFFIRQRFDTKKHCFTTIKNSDFICQCRSQGSLFEELLGKISVGDTVLIPFKRSGEPSRRPIDSYGFSDKISDTLEAVVVERYLPESQTMTVRRLVRRSACPGGDGAAPNELVWTDDFLSIVPELVGPKTYVRFYGEGEQVHSPYNRNGSGNTWYITTRLTQTGELEKLVQPFPTSLNQGLDPTAPPPRPPMVGLDLFAGGGNFGRGLEEGAAVSFLYAIDWAKNAVRTYMANCSGEEPKWVYWGSVNDYLRHVMDGSNMHYFSKIGGIDFIAAGSPCQGFSRLQRNKASDTSLRNISMVASVAAYIDVYRPKYALLENVPAMAREQLGVFPQLLCTLVGMGYQVSQDLLDAWSHRDSQKRSRLFVTITAPGLVPVPPVVRTHSHPLGTDSISLGRIRANNQKFGERLFVPTPFKYVSVKESMGDLPNISDSHIQTCIKYPDHRTVATEAAWARSMVRHIPVHPPVQGAMDAIRAGVMPQAIADRFLRGGGIRVGEKSRSWSRVPADGLTSTITTAPAPACGINGRVLHWQQHRVLSIREARRAQGFDEGEIITGSPAEQWKIIGNSVSRGTARALGMALQEAWLANPPDHCSSTSSLPISSDTGSAETAVKSSASSPIVVVQVPSGVDDIEPPRPRLQIPVVIDLTQDGG